MTDMTYARLGSSGPVVSRMYFGTMPFSLGSKCLPCVA
jgi:aryl-alcohol dehydrogenase-like predicted oxidoreductase